MKCKDCYHYESCYPNKSKNSLLSKIDRVNICKYFKDKSKIIELPTDLEKDVYCIASPCSACERYNETLTEENIKDNINACRNCNRLEIIVCKFDYELIPDFGKTVFLTKEEAEQRLEELQNA